MTATVPFSAKSRVASFNEHRLHRLEESVAHTRTKLDVVGIRLEWLGRKLLSTELEKAELRRTLAERIWELNLLRYEMKHEQAYQEDDVTEQGPMQALTVAE